MKNIQSAMRNLSKAAGLQKMKGVPRSIYTVEGKAKYKGTELEDKSGKWSQNYWTTRAEWVIHKGKYHHVYSTNYMKGGTK